MKLFVDMDGVLVNFLGATDIILGRDFNDPILGSEEDKWKVLVDIPNFWLNLEWLPDAQLLWNRIKYQDSYIITACPSYDPRSFVDKKIWCQTHMGIGPERVFTIPRAEKKNFAVLWDRETAKSEQNLLIDDYKKTVDEWIVTGGVGIHHKSVVETLDKLTEFGF